MGRMAPVSLPGAQAPAAGFDQPFELLAACHDRVRQRLDLLARLLDHLAVNGADRAAHEAAADVLRYFDVAAPLHHEDEECHLVPRLLASPEAAHRAAAQRLLDDHVEIRAGWQRLRPLLQGLTGAPGAALREAAAHFIALHGPHLELEDGLVYPIARRDLGADASRAMGHEMAARRGARPPLSDLQR